MVIQTLQLKFKRLLNNTAAMERLYLIWLLITLVLIGFFGIGTLVPNILKRAVLLSDMLQTNAKLSANISALTTTKITIEDNAPGVSNLYRAVSPNSNTQNYLVDYFNMATISGFSGSRFNTVTSDTPGNVDIIAEVTGDGSIIDFIRRLEGLSRITNVKSVEYVDNIYVKTISTTVTIFNLPFDVSSSQNGVYIQ